MNLGGSISQDDLDRVSSRDNSSSFLGGFEDSNSSSDFSFDSSDDIFGGGSDDLFGGSDDIFGGGSDDLFGGSSDDIFGGGSNDIFGGSDDIFGGGGSDDLFGRSSSFGGDPFGRDSFGGDAFGNDPLGGYGGSSFNGYGNNQMNGGSAAIARKPDTADKIMEASTDAAKSLWVICKELAASVKLRTANDFAFFGRNLIIYGGVLVPSGLLVSIIGSIMGIKFLSFSGFPMQLLLSGLMVASSGLMAMGISSLVLEKIGEKEAMESNMPLDDFPDASTFSSDIDDSTDLFESSIGAEMDDAMSDELDKLFEDFDFDSISSDEDDTDDIKDDIDIADIDDIDVDDADVDDGLEFKSDGLLDNVDENGIITRELLYNTFKPMLPFKTPNFAGKTEIDRGSELFNQLQAICLKAMSRILKKEIEEVNSRLEEAYDSFFSYELKMIRVNGLSKIDAFEAELEFYVRENKNETGVTATVDIEGDYFKIIITKGTKAIVTFGDIFKQKYCEDFFLNTKHELPIISGIDELGNVILEDGKKIDSMMICGKPRSGKSWYVLSVLMSLMMFNSPEDVQLIIVDPKKSNLFKTMSLMPHVAGLHDGDNILDLLVDIIETEGNRRKKLFEDEHVDDIWSLREKGIRLPVLFIVMDEYISLKNNLGPAGKELDKKLVVLITQLPSLGIRPIIVPHRAMGVVDKVNRVNINFAAAVKADTEVIIETLDIKNWTRPLTEPGDIALKSASMPMAKFVKGPALTTSDSQNTELIRTVAKAFYKIGVDLPDMSNMRIAYNRDNDYIREELSDGSTRVQYNAENILKDID